MPHYRFEMIKGLAESGQYEYHMAYSPGRVPGSKVTSIEDASPFVVHHLKWRGTTLPLAGRGYSLGFFPGLLPLLRRLKPDVVLVEAESNFVVDMMLMSYSLFSSVPYVLWGCGRVRNTEETYVRKSLYPFLCMLFGRAKAVVGYSRYAVDYYSSTYHVPRERCFFAPNSIPATAADEDRQAATQLRESLGLGPDKVVLLSVGAITKDKNLDMLFQLFREVRARHPEAELVVVGGGNYLEHVKQTYGADPGVHIMGAIYDKVNLYFQMSDIFILPGLGGLALQQAVQNGKPVVCSIADGTELDLVKNGLNGYFIEPEAPLNEWVEKVSLLVADPEMRRRFGQHARYIVEHEFNSDLMFQGIENALAYALAK
jgi:glycosyltransferase involved in cell wall biosynthesis